MVTNTLSGRTVQFTYTDEEGDEVVAHLPARHEVCSRCEGHGTHLNPSIGEHAYTMEEFHEAFDDEEARQYFTRGGIYDVTCQECLGRNVVKVVDVSACSSPEQKALLKRFQDSERDDAEYEALCRSEARMGC